MPTMQDFHKIPNRTKEEKTKLTMQAFHSRLFQATEVYDPELKGLFQLTQATSTQMTSLSSDLGWTDWDSKVA
jgi:hypothetical protein